MKSIKVGMIGAGAIAGNHCNDINSHPRGEVVAVADKSKKRGNELKKQFGMAKAYTEIDDMLSDPDIDAVSIALPNFLHAPVSIAALKAGKHVLLDKPFALNQKEAKQVLDAAKKAKKVFMLGMNQRFNPACQTVKALVQRGELGDIYHAKAYWMRRSGSPKFGTWFCSKKLAGGGGMLDIGVHALDLCLYLMDNFKPAAVSGAAYSEIGPHTKWNAGWGKSDSDKSIKFDVDDFATALIKFKNGATVALDASWLLHMGTGGRQGVELFGDKAGASAFDGKLFRPSKAFGEYEVVEPQGVQGPMHGKNRFTHWIDVMLKEAKADCTAAQALAVQKILDGIYESSKTGKEVRIK